LPNNNGRGSDRGTITNFPGGGFYQPFKPKPLIFERFETFSPAQWYQQDAQGYDWMVEGCMLKGTVVMLSGDGGLGKSLIMQQLLTAASIGANWFGRKTKKGKGIALFCEDDEDELHRRQEKINDHYGCEHPDVEVLYSSRVGMENILAEFERRTDRIEPTPLWDQFQEAALDFGVQYAVIDTVADAFGGQEYVRVQVRRFITMLRQFAMRIQGVVIITAHPSVMGMSSGSGISGSTAWNNSVRSRMYLTRPRRDAADNDPEELEDDNRRILRTMKNNQGPGSGEIDLTWKDGVFVREQDRTLYQYEKPALDRDVYEFLRWLISMDSRVALNFQAPNCLAKLAKKRRELASVSAYDIEASQARLLESGRVVVVELIGPSRHIHKYLRPADMRYSDEKEST